jgi:hypothetical protein
MNRYFEGKLISTRLRRREASADGASRLAVIANRDKGAHGVPGPQADAIDQVHLQPLW